ncbi:DUF1254 domain-containing protein [Allomesorhizobium alhagi]|uniref:Carboxylesterase n=1 Tax=Mesorhizobium alhagi CCNWXJ12-2 TaxID=1107882 RepID=H0I2X4_9HYPH|nr:DUF1254 domain-containing protein [Mesorhizobium alhagi]EHK52682.1 hypothetical protein MAXJ12_34159 [Mesorhizobium alhagi CCNWXJ12-2]
MSHIRSAVSAAALIAIVAALPAAADPIPVTSDNFIRAESDLYFSAVIARNRFGKFDHDREMTPLDKQAIIRLNRDTLYSSAVFDLDAGPVTVTLPDTGGRFMSMQVFDQDHYTHGVYYEPGTYTFTRDEIGTRYVFPGIRILANPEDPEDMKAVHALQDKITAEQTGGPGKFEIPDWDSASRDKTRAIILQLAEPLPDTRGMFGAKHQVHPVRHFIGTAMAWGGNPEADALYLNRTVAKNDGKTVYRLNVGEVPVKAFWSISIYNAEGFYEPNELNAYTINNLTAAKDANGGVTVQFGGCDGKIPNCLPTPEGWNWMVRLYRPESQILDGSWEFPAAEEVK